MLERNRLRALAKLHTVREAEQRRAQLDLQAALISEAQALECKQQAEAEVAAVLGDWRTLLQSSSLGADGILLYRRALSLRAVNLETASGAHLSAATESARRQGVLALIDAHARTLKRSANKLRCRLRNRLDERRLRDAQDRFALRSGR